MTGIAPLAPFKGPRRHPVFFAEQPSIIPTYAITGVTKDATGTVLGSVTLDLFRTLDEMWSGNTTSDGSGVYSLPVAQGERYYIVAYKAGATDVAGTTKNTLTGVNTLTGL